MGKSFWIFGALVERTRKCFSIFVDSEHLKDVRQTKWGLIYTLAIGFPAGTMPPQNARDTNNILD